jgi:hypothetical protein
MSGAGQVELLQFWFPGWQATVDGIRVGTGPSGPQAVVSCDVPAGEHLVEFRYRGLSQRRTGIIVSIIAIAIGGVRSLSSTTRTGSHVVSSGRSGACYESIVLSV